MRPNLVCLLLALIAAPVLAQVDSRALTDVEKAQKLDRARVLKDEAAQQQKAADEALKAENEACYKKFQVSSCLSEAKKKHTLATREAKRKDQEGGELERDVKRRDVAAKDAKRTADAPVHEAQQKEKAEAFRAEEAAKAEKRSEHATVKKEQAALGRQKREAEKERYARKQEQLANKEAKAAAKREKREAKKAADEAKKKAQEEARQQPAKIW